MPESILPFPVGTLTDSERVTVRHLCEKEWQKGNVRCTHHTATWMIKSAGGEMWLKPYEPPQEEDDYSDFDYEE